MVQFNTKDTKLVQCKIEPFKHAIRVKGFQWQWYCLSLIIVVVVHSVKPFVDTRIMSVSWHQIENILCSLSLRCKLSCLYVGYPV
jgi:hypothetical protein